MNRFRKALCVDLVLLLLVASVPAVPVADLGFGITASALDANGSCGDNATYTFDSATGKLVISGTGAIAAEACYRNKAIKEVVIGDGITEIREGAFERCEIIHTINIPRSVTTIGDSAFRETAYVEDNYKTDVNYEGSEEEWNKIKIGRYNYNIDYSTIYFLADGIGLVDSGDCGENVFWRLYTDGKLVISGTGPMYDFATSSSSPFSFNEKITSVEIEYGVTTTGRWSFYSCSNLEEIIIPESIKTISYGCFEKCSSLRGIDIPDSVTKIEAYAFFGAGLESVVIPGSVETIEYCTFRYNTSLKTVTIEEGVPYIADMFSMCTSLESVSIPLSVKSVSSSAFASCTSLKDIYYAGDKASWNKISFKNYSEIENATIHFLRTNLTVVKTGNCGKTATWTLYDNGELVIEGTGKINAEAFYQNQDIKEVVIGDGITEIGADAFYGCSNLTTVDFGNTVTVIGYKAFLDCDSLTSVEIPDSVITVGDYAFYNCNSLTSVTIGDSVTTIGNDAFCDCDNIASIIIPDSVITIGKEAFFKCNNLASVVIGNGVTTIYDYAFFDCYNLTSVTVGSSVESIHYNAFNGCASLESINIPKTVTSIGNEAFRYCPSLYDVYYEGSEAEWNVIDIGSNNTGLENAEIHFGAVSEPSTGCEHNTGEHTVIQRVEPTCTEDGHYRYYQCKCGVYFNRFNESNNQLTEVIEDPTTFGVIPALGHDFIEDKCSRCGDYDVCKHDKANTLYVAGKNPTCTEDGFKSYYICQCGAKVQYPSLDNPKVLNDEELIVSALGHDMFVIESIVPTCQAEGNNRYYGCDRCDKYFKDAEGCIETTKAAETIAKGEHVFTKYAISKDATCTANAIEKAVCDFCGEATHEREIAGTKVAHLYKIYVSNNDATCVADGTMTAVCEICKMYKDTMTDVGSHKTAAHTPDAKGERCTLCGAELVCLHTYSVEKLITKTPTCTEKGQKANVCSKCKANKPGSEEVIPALGHDWNEFIISTAPTCTTTGIEYSICKREGCNWEANYEIPALGHDFVYGKCTRCGDYEYGCNHIWGAWVITTAATCAKTGIRERKCTRAGCGEIEKEVLPLKDHYYDVKITYPTCTKDGYSTYTCTTCNDSYVAQKVEKYGHDYEEVYEEQPTCTEDGYFEYSCTRCGDWYSETVESYGHDFDYIEDFASCTEDGYYEYYCNRCGYSESGVIEAYGHTYPDQWSVIIPATCKETGVAVKVCFDCHEVIAMVVPKAGHSDFDGDSKCDTCGGTITVVEPEKPADKPEEKPCNCDCHAGGIKAFFFKLINFFAKIFDKNARVCDCGKAH